MKKLIFILLLFTVSLSAQSWNSIITTSINVANTDYIENHADKDGIHIVVHEDNSNDIKYYLISSSGSTIRSATISTNGQYPNIVGDGNAVYVIYREGSNIRVKKSTNAGASWINRKNQYIGSNECSGIDAAINDDVIHTVWSIGDANGYNMETNYKKYKPSNNSWVDFYNVTNYSGGYGTTPTVSVSPSRVHVGYNSCDHVEPYYAVDEDEMSRTKYNNNWQTKQTIASNESGRGKIFTASSKLYDFYYDVVIDMGVHHDLYYKYRNYGSTSWSSQTLLEGFSDVTVPLVICETANGHVHTYTASDYIKERVIINGSVNSTSNVSNNGGVKTLSATSNHNDIYLNWRKIGSNYLKLRQYDAEPAAPKGISKSWVNGGEEDGNPRIDWDANTEADLAHYEIWKKIDNWSGPDVNWFVKTTTTSTYYIDYDEQGWSTFSPPRKVYYKIKAVDVNNNKSSYSNSVMFYCGQELNKESSEKLVSAKPITFKLEKNYPNPFNPSTTISYQLPKAAYVTLKVYDVLGKEVEELVNENKSAGIYNVTFNADDLPSGLYFYKIEAGKYSAVRKMMLMK